MKRRQALEKACFLLREQAKEESIAKFLLQYILDENSGKFNYNMDAELEKELENKYFGLIEEHIEKDTPLSHLAGFEYFYNRKFKVNKNVLSPRMETEELIYKILDDFKYCDKKYLKILDLCTGSGIIGITLEKELKIATSITASDISKEALQVARRNAELLQSSVHFIESNLFENIEDKFDVIVSNPPYIPYEDMSTIKKNVLDYDPHLALFAKEEGMFFYKRIIESADKYLEEDGIIYFEIGYNQREKIQDIANNHKFICQIIKDINSKDRIAILSKEK
ncbi:MULTISPECIES: peptide chain release factor N(5)-glutamine methyltransferase [unclassified Gemella]|uniref:peptide chain release factor N(5)-glutamine methyltransferase n=1 Tax=unclassified Gemella TaxID=2624949 RepID=UPI00107358AC|nr:MULTISPECIES: peptide chain release factor N(5)-glutamine methyltransferase [unclassified Gemella]MBF0710095.1 peptide chain release factor N(5)-glutamine methyltransferase [Gemella sp. GL1.1]MBF0746174.1 peptide chain release factor N(5)-glutamine methyltransferase [Gemella sp. 19428wG2_WT2a]NYS27439.1 peptide chain release factor N(5)-glutamine methyltransferase [Gemella sp. GL1]TFU60459.1 peptide chain release factor N(5)-glutamine methyltransferase [Gemella sp. WT2a]